MTTSREDFEALMPEPAAYCEPDNPLNRQAFAWPGLGRGFMHTTPLYTADQMHAMFEAATERAAKVGAAAAHDAAMKYAGGYAVDFDKAVGDVIRGAK